MARTRDDEVKFSWSQFWISFLYENLPPVFVSPFAVLMVERSRALNHQNSKWRNKYGWQIFVEKTNPELRPRKLNLIITRTRHRHTPQLL